MSRVIKNPSIVSGGVVYTSYVDVPLISSNTHNLVVADLSSNVLLRMSSSGNYNLTGIVNPDGQGREIKIFNVGTNNIILKNLDANSLAANRFQNGSDKSLQAGEGIALIYDVVDLKWKAFGINI